jgi:uncharacterized LabA/DUF88 family protein
MQKTTYFFIDGNYVREALNAAMRTVFDVPGDIAPEAIASSDAFRSYFYDCKDEQKKDKETEAEFKARLEAQDATFARMHSRPGLHLRLGTVKGQRRREQKEVDILLAVDMLTHGFNRSMTHAVLIAGDLDFRPVVEALVRSGIFVEVWYEQRSVAKELPGAADFGKTLSWDHLYSWNSQTFREQYKPPTVQGAFHPPITPIQVAVGYCNGRNVELMTWSNRGAFVLRVEISSGVHWLEHGSREVIERFCEMKYGAIKWK